MRVADNCIAPDRACFLNRKDHIAEPIDYQHTYIKVSQEPKFTYLRQALCRRNTHFIVWIFGVRSVLFREGRLRITNRCPECVLGVWLATNLYPPMKEKRHTCVPDASHPRISCGSSSSFISSHCRSSSAGTKRLSKSIESPDAAGRSALAFWLRFSCVDDPLRGRIDLLRGGGGGICVFGVTDRRVSRGLLAEIGIGAGVCRGIVARVDEGASSRSAWPRVMTVNSALTPSNWYSNCRGLQGRVYRAVTVAFAVSACATTALKSFRLIATCMFSSTKYSWKSRLSAATDVWTGCFSTSVWVVS